MCIRDRGCFTWLSHCQKLWNIFLLWTNLIKKQTLLIDTAYKTNDIGDYLTQTNCVLGLFVYVKNDPKKLGKIWGEIRNAAWPIEDFSGHKWLFGLFNYGSSKIFCDLETRHYLTLCNTSLVLSLSLQDWKNFTEWWRVTQERKTT